MPQTNDQYGTIMNDGLENFLWKLSLPNTPSYNVNTDNKFYIYMWFHNSAGSLITNPFLDLGRFKYNHEFEKHGHLGIAPALEKRAQAGAGLDLGQYCFDLTPFVQEISMPEIQSSANATVETLLGNMATGGFSPYASDGNQRITMQVVDTEYSILDAMFYPWMKMIGMPRWYDRIHAFSSSLTPYPICTIEVVTPMRRYKEPGGGGSTTYNYYSYEFVGARPSGYAPPETNQQGKNSLLRNLTMVCDLVLVDMVKDSVIHKDPVLKESGGPQPSGTKVIASVPEVAPAGPAEADPQVDPRNGDAAVDDIAADRDKLQKKADKIQKDAKNQNNGEPPGDKNDEKPVQGDEKPKDPVDPAPVGPSDEPGHDDSPPNDNPPPAVSPVDSVPSDGGLPIEGVNGVDGPAAVAGSDAVNAADGNSVDDAKGAIVAAAAKAAVQAAGGNPVAAAVANAVVNSANDPESNAVDNITSTVTPLLVTAATAALAATPLAPLAPLAGRVISSVVKSVFKSTPSTSSAKSTGAAAELDVAARDINSIGKITTVLQSLNRRYKFLPNRKSLASEAYLSLVDSHMTRNFPSNSIPFTFGPTKGLWLTGVYLAPLHNTIIEALGMNLPLCKTVRNPFINRTQWFSWRLPAETKDAILDDMLYEFQDELEERALGDFVMRQVAMWEIINPSFNFTGEYWCKVWLTNAGDEVTNGRVIICKLNYLGDVVRGQTEDFDSNIFQHPLDNLQLLITKPELNFNREVAGMLFDSTDTYELKVSGAYEREFNPMTAVVRSKHFSRSSELEWVEGKTKLVSTGKYHLEELFLDDSGAYHAMGPDGNFVSMESLMVDGVSREGYTILSTDPDRVSEDPSTKFMVTHLSAYEAYSEFENFKNKSITTSAKTDLTALKPDNRAVEGQDSSDSILYFKFFNTFSGHPAGSLVKWDNPTSTTSDVDIFDAYIPDSIDYVVQYEQQKTRLWAMNVEQTKLLQILYRLRTKRNELSSELPVIRNRLVDLNELLSEAIKMGQELELLSIAYTELTDAELHEETNLVAVKKTHQRAEAYYANSDYSELDKYLARAEDLHLADSSLSRCEKALFDIRQKEREILSQYETLSKQLAELLESLRNDSGEPLVVEYGRLCYRHAYITKYLTALDTEIGYFDEFYKWRRDRCNKVERLVEFFKRRVDGISSLLDASTDDLILYYDWLAQSIELTDLERHEANKMAYVLRTEVKLPGLHEEIKRLDKKIERLVTEKEQSTQLVFDTSVDEDEEQEPIYSSYSSGYTASKVHRDAETSAGVPKEVIEKVLKQYRNTHPKFRTYSNAELKDSLLLILSRNYLLGEGSKLHAELLSTRREVEKMKQIVADYEVEVKRAMELMNKAIVKRKSIAAEIERLTRRNNELFSKGPTKDEELEIRNNISLRVDRESALKEFEGTLKSLVSRYEHEVLPTRDRYASELSSVRKQYESLLETLAKEVNFDEKMLELGNVVR